ncbi:MAG: undecaprenyldiphospho-muramoylpentapeptide beta-N-acetylglucosaminyltransferase [Campylobacterota bacterium]
MKEKVVITGGGTGGHLKVADCLIEEFIKKDIDVIFIGSTNGQDINWFKGDKRIYKTFFLDTKGVVNKKGLSKIFSLINILKKLFYCLKLFSKYNIKKVISVGGFSAAPATFASIIKPGCKLFIHEQNSKMGKLNEISSKFATLVFSSFHDFSPIKDYPVSEEFFKESRLRSEIKTVAFFGGSQGAKRINDFAIELAPKLDSMGIKIIHQAGKNDYNRVKKEYKKLGLEVDVFDFTKGFISKMKQADLAVSRAGASTLWEMTANGLPGFYIPYKYAASNHQYYNAKKLVDENLAFVCNEDSLSVDKFLDVLNCDVETLSKKLINYLAPNGAKSIVETIQKY